MPSTPQADRERKRQLDRQRLSPSKRGYGRDWQKVRALKLRAEPRCEPCLERGKLVWATVVDHIVSIEERPDLRLSLDNLRSCCKPCHDRRTAADQGFNRDKTTIERTGCDANGFPLGDHPWNR
jgi:5-methylcytosine-specific restriction protein A